MNESLWSACGTANASLFNSAQYNDPVPAILSYLRSQSQAEVAAMTAAAELYGTFQVNWRSEVINSEQGTSGTNALHLAAFESDLAWAQKVASARDAYYAELGESTSSFNESFLDALESYNSSMLGAEFARAQGLFNASKDYSLGSYSIESEYARTRFETSAAYSLSMLDAAVAEMVGLADMEAYYARKSADEYAGIGIDENGITRRWDIDTKNSTAAYEKRTLITETKKAADALLNALNQSNTTADDAEYQGSLLTLQAVYDAAIALAEETYNSTEFVASANFDTVVITAERQYEFTLRQFDKKFEEAVHIISNGDELPEDYFDITVTTEYPIQYVSNDAIDDGFSGDMLVVMADGSTKMISDIRTGDMVLAVSENNPNGSTAACLVTDVYCQDIDTLIILTFSDANENVTILECGSDHNFYVAEKGWITAINITEGDKVILESGDVITLTGRSEVSRITRLYTISVATGHTFFITSDEQQYVLVHNKGKIIGWVIKSGAKLFKITPIYNEHLAAKLFRKNVTKSGTVDILVSGGKGEAKKLAERIQKLLSEKVTGKVLHHEGHPNAAKNLLGQVVGDGTHHFQLNKIKGHIFYSGLAGILITGADKSVDGNEYTIDITKAYSDPIPGRSYAAGLSVQYWTGEAGLAGWMGFAVDIVNPGDMIALGGDLLKDARRAVTKEFEGYIVTIKDKNGNPVTTLTLSPEGTLVSLAQWKDGVMGEVIPANDFLID